MARCARLPVCATWKWGNCRSSGQANESERTPGTGRLGPGLGSRGAGWGGAPKFLEGVEGAGGIEAVLEFGEGGGVAGTGVSGTGLRGGARLCVGVRLR